VPNISETQKITPAKPVLQKNTNKNANRIYVTSFIVFLVILLVIFRVSQEIKRKQESNDRMIKRVRGQRESIEKRNKEVRDFKTKIQEKIVDNMLESLLIQQRANTELLQSSDPFPQPDYDTQQKRPN